MERVNQKTSSKFYDKAVFNGWDLGFEYESENGAVPMDIRVQGEQTINERKSGINFFMNKNNGNVSMNFNNGVEIDSDLVAYVNQEFKVIENQFLKK